MNPKLARRPLLALTLFAPLAAQAQTRDLNEAINKSGSLRMLGQRCTKAYLAIGQGVRDGQAQRVLQDSVALFERRLQELRPQAGAPALLEQLSGLGQIWSTHRVLLLGQLPARERAGALLDSTQRLLQGAQSCTEGFERLSGRPLGRLVNRAGRQRMLSQRLAMLSLARAWGLPTPAAELVRGRDEFLQAQAELKAAPQTTAELRAELERVEQQFVFFAAALQAEQLSARALDETFSTSERMLELLDGITIRYAQRA